MHFLSQLQYRGWYLEILMAVIFVITDPIDAMLLLDRFGTVGGMRASQILLVYATAVCSFGLAELFGRGFDSFPWLVRTGEFDRILLRPRSTIVQTMTLRFHLHRLARVIGMGSLMILCIRMENVSLGIGDIAMLILALVSGMLVYIGIFIITSAIAFFTIEALDYVFIFTNGSYQTAKVPPKLLPDWLRRTFTYVVPMFAFCYYPIASIFGWGEARFTAYYLAFPIGVAFVEVALALWYYGVRHYRSAGS